jgi:hypothetical protein
MKKIVMLDDHQGARKGDIVGFESDEEADAVIEAGKAEAFDLEKHGPPGEDGKHENPHAKAEGETQTITAADVGTLKP